MSESCKNSLSWLLTVWSRERELCLWVVWGSRKSWFQLPLVLFSSSLGAHHYKVEKRDKSLEGISKMLGYLAAPQSCSPVIPMYIHTGLCTHNSCLKSCVPKTSCCQPANINTFGHQAFIVCKILNVLNEMGNLTSPISKFYLALNPDLSYPDLKEYQKSFWEWLG